jgi:hypothetical protein
MLRNEFIIFFFFWWWSITRKKLTENCIIMRSAWCKVSIIILQKLAFCKICYSVCMFVFLFFILQKLAFCKICYSIGMYVCFLVFFVCNHFCSAFSRSNMPYIYSRDRQILIISKNRLHCPYLPDSASNVVLSYTYQWLSMQNQAKEITWCY